MNHGSGKGASTRDNEIVGPGPKGLKDCSRFSISLLGCISSHLAPLVRRAIAYQSQYILLLMPYVHSMLLTYDHGMLLTRIDNPNATHLSAAATGV